MINYGRQFIDKKDIAEVAKVLKSDWLTQGPQVTKFEKNLKFFFGAKYCSVLCNGTAALHLSGLALGWKKNDIIITTPISFLATSNSILYSGAKPLFIDIDPKNYLIDLNKLEESLIKLKKRGKKVKAVVITDYAGHPCDWKRVKNLSEIYGFQTINDNCHAMGSKYFGDEQYAIKYSDIVIQSYHPVKAFTSGEGGSVMTNNTKIFNKISKLRTHGVFKNSKLMKQRGRWFYKMLDLGYNYRLSDIHCALGNSQLKKITKFVEKRRKVANYYNKCFGSKNLFIIPFESKHCDHSFHLYPLQIKFQNIKTPKKIFFDKLFKKGINLQVHYIPIHLQEYYKKKFGFKVGDFPISENFYKNVVSLPIYYLLEKKNLKKIVFEIFKLCGKT